MSPVPRPVLVQELSDHCPTWVGPGPDGLGERHDAALALVSGADCYARSVAPDGLTVIAAYEGFVLDVGSSDSGNALQ